MKNSMLEAERGFVQTEKFSQVVEFIYDARLFKENEVVFLKRCFEECQKEENADVIKNSLGYRTMLFYAAKHGFAPSTQHEIMMVLNAGENDGEEKGLLCSSDLLAGIVNNYAMCHTIDECAMLMYEELKRKGVVDTLPEYSGRERYAFIRKQISAFTKYIRSWGICYLD